MEALRIAGLRVRLLCNWIFFLGGGGGEFCCVCVQQEKA